MNPPERSAEVGQLDSNETEQQTEEIKACYSDSRKRMSTEAPHGDTVNPNVKAFTEEVEQIPANFTRLMGQPISLVMLQMKKGQKLEADLRALQGNLQWLESVFQRKQLKADNTQKQKMEKMESKFKRYKVWREQPTQNNHLIKTLKELSALGLRKIAEINERLSEQERSQLKISEITIERIHEYLKEKEQSIRADSYSVEEAYISKAQDQRYAQYIEVEQEKSKNLPIYPSNLALAVQNQIKIEETSELFRLVQDMLPTTVQDMLPTTPDITQRWLDERNEVQVRTELEEQFNPQNMIDEQVEGNNDDAQPQVQDKDDSDNEEAK